MKIKREEAQDHLDKISKFAQDHLMDHGEHPMILVCFGPNGPSVVDMTNVLSSCENMYSAGQNMLGHAIKDFMGHTMRTILADLKAFGYILVNEAWVSTYKRDKIAVAYGDEPGKAKVKTGDVPMPRDDPKRQEALCVAYEFVLEEGGRLEGMRTYIFHRDGEKIVKVDSPSEVGGNETQGRFVRMLEEGHAL